MPQVAVNDETVRRRKIAIDRIRGVLSRAFSTAREQYGRDHVEDSLGGSPFDCAVIEQLGLAEEAVGVILDNLRTNWASHTLSITRKEEPRSQ